MTFCRDHWGCFSQRNIFLQDTLLRLLGLYLSLQHILTERFFVETFWVVPVIETYSHRTTLCWDVWVCTSHWNTFLQDDILLRPLGLYLSLKHIPTGRDFVELIGFVKRPLGLLIGFAPLIETYSHRTTLCRDVWPGAPARSPLLQLRRKPRRHHQQRFRYGGLPLWTHSHRQQSGVSIFFKGNNR